MFKLFQGENWFWSSHFPWQHTFTPVIHIPQIHIPHIEVPSSCEVANASCLQQCGSVENMNFQCQEDHGVMSSCTCSSIQGGIQAGRSDTERCNEAKAVCESECGISRTAKFQCSDSGSSFSKSCSCSSTNSQSYYYQGPPHYYHYDYTPSFQGLGQCHTLKMSSVEMDALTAYKSSILYLSLFGLGYVKLAAHNLVTIFFLLIIPKNSSGGHLLYNYINLVTCVNQSLLNQSMLIYVTCVKGCIFYFCW
eukprot:TRINITY_DN3973_c0_g1_i1.p1 TRINITY_DN3973_c0_g1~~TRINITY_DN3973_c0_g1_i1.p1  ORF type:complete len:250 (+),score=5.35 TRINITY_DN3973_c0_g1_i1:134-883(+)